MTRHLRLLLVEDSPADAELLLHRLRREGLELDWLRVESPDAMRAALADRPWDVVISDWALPSFSAPDARRLLTESGQGIPFIIVSGTIGEDAAVSALKAGAHDFLTKGNLTRLVPAIDREMRDADERRTLRAMEKALVATRERMRFALEAAGVGTWEWDVASDRVIWSDILERLHGLPAGEFGGTFAAFVATVHPADRQRIHDDRDQFLGRRADSRLEYRVTWPDGSVHWLATIGRSFHDEHGRPVRAAGVGIDITEQKRLAEQLLQSRKMESIGNLAGGIAHDFNNLLTAIAGYCELLIDRPGFDAGAREDVEEIRQVVTGASDLTRQLLAFSRKQVLAPRVVDLNGVVNGVTSMLRRLIEENVRIEFQLAPDLARVAVDPGQIEQVLINLAVNARDAMPQGGTLTIHTGNVVIGEGGGESALQPGPHVLLSVADTGRGIPAGVRERLFEPFFTTKPKGRGTGLGLATVYGIVEQSGGQILVESEPGSGAVFKVYLPAVSGEPAPAVATPPARRAELGGTETILVVEDDPRLLALDERVLRRRGYRVLVAADAPDALRILSEHRDPIHLVLTDVIMPGGSGRTVGDWVLAHRPDIRVVYMSGYTGDAIARHGVLEPGMRFLQKPYSPDELARTVREALS